MNVTESWIKECDVIFWRLDREGRLVSISPAAKRFEPHAWKLSHEPPPAWLPPRFRNDFGRKMRLYFLRDPRKKSFTHLLLLGSRRHLTFHTTVYPVFDNGTIVGFRGHSTPLEGFEEESLKKIGQLQTALSQLQEAEKMAQTGYWEYDPIKQIGYWSEGSFAIFGYPAHVRPPLTLERFFSHVHPKDMAKVRQAVRSALQDPTYRYDLTYRIIRYDGSEAVIHSRATVIFERGKPIHARGVVHDITQKVRLQRQNEEKNRLLQHQSKLAEMGQLLQNITHQWKQPLARLNALLIELEQDFLDGKLDQDRFARFFERFEATTAFMKETLDHFHGYLAPSPQPPTLFDPLKPLKTALSLLEGRLASLKVKVRIRRSEPASIMGVAEDLTHVFMILLNNALDAFESRNVPDPSLEIRFQNAGEKLSIHIIDNAGGIENGIAQRLFEPYVSTHYKKTGRGLGLFIARSVVASKFDGELTLSDPNRSIFTLTFRREQ